MGQKINKELLLNNKQMLPSGFYVNVKSCKIERSEDGKNNLFYNVNVYVSKAVRDENPSLKVKDSEPIYIQNHCVILDEQVSGDLFELAYNDLKAKMLITFGPQIISYEPIMESQQQKDIDGNLMEVEGEPVMIEVQTGRTPIYEELTSAHLIESDIENI